MKSMKIVLQRWRLFLLAIALVAGYSSDCSGPNEPKEVCERVFFKIPAKPEDYRSDVLTSTGIQIRVGDTVSVLAKGTWTIGLGDIGPDGDIDRSSCAIVGCPADAPFGALIGRIGDGAPFLIGSQKTFIAEASGVLFLGSNDNAKGTCFGDVGSCYDDNKGELCVKVTVK